MRECVQHRGVVESVEGRIVTVSVERESACAGCHAKGICGVDGQKRVIKVDSDHAAMFQPGERVVVALLATKMGFSSVVWGYVLPLVVMLATLFSIKATGCSDGIAAIGSLCSVAVYYVMLYVLRHTIERKIKFTIIKE
jgi:sigma-E factor negative regulatory protein RseC